MTDYLFSSLTGNVFFDNSFKVKGSSKEADEIKFDSKELYKALEVMRENADFSALYEANLRRTEADIKASVSFDTLLSQAVNNIDEIDKTINLHAKRLREWYELYFPEVSRRITDHEKFAAAISGKDREQLTREMGLDTHIGADIRKEDISQMNQLAQLITELAKLRESHKAYIERQMDSHCTHLKEAAGVLIGAKLIALAGSFRRLALLPASTIQLLGAEKALFRHLASRARCPKYGVIMQHPFVSSLPNKGKAARQLANRISKAVKVDYFEKFKA